MQSRGKRGPARRPD